MGWTDKQRRFVEEYCVDFNATQAAIRAGYSETSAHVTACRMLRNAKDYAHVQEAIRERLDVLSMSADEALYRFTEQARNVQMRYLNEDGTIDLGGLIDDGLAHLVKGTKFNAQGQLIVEFHDAQSALRDIARVRGLLGPKGTADDPQHIAPIEVHIINAPADADG